MLSTGSVIETYVMHVLMYGSENWILTERCIDLLVSFLGEIAKEHSSGRNTSPTQRPC